jgi:general secretion pathway protein H
MNRGCRGFSIIELLVVIGIMGVMVAIIVPFYVGYRPKLMLSRASTDVLSSLRMTRQRAVAEARRHTVHFDWTNESYRIDTGPWKPLGLQIDLEQGSGFTEDSLAFDADGKASSSGKIVLGSSRVSDKFEIYVSIAGFTKMQHK